MKCAISQTVVPFAIMLADGLLDVIQGFDAHHATRSHEFAVL